MRELLRRLAGLGPGDAPVLSVYLDMRPHGTEPALRPGLLLLKERLRAIEKTLWPRGVAYDSVRADAVRIARYLDDVPSDAQGVALFTCAAGDLFETVTVGVPFENQVVAAPVPDLFQPARLLDEQETVLVAVVDTNTARIFVTRTGYLDEVGGPDDKNTKYYRKVSLGGLNEARYQRHADERRAEFAREAAAELERVVDQEDAARVILAGDEVALPLLRTAPPQVWWITLGRDRTLAGMDPGALRRALAGAGYHLSKQWGYVPEAPSYQAVKRRLLHRPDYPYKLQVMLFSRPS